MLNTKFGQTLTSHRKEILKRSHKVKKKKKKKN
jgi:hypothetical protein